MKKFDLSKVVDRVKASMKDDKRRSQVRLGSELHSLSDNPEDYVVMPDWWKDAYGFMGLPIGKIIQIAGDSDSGKTSLCIQAMKAAQEQEQEIAVCYVETELKTSPEDLRAWGVDPDNILLVQSSIVEEAFDSAFKMIDAFFDQYPNGKLLFIYDSYGNVVSMRDSEIDIVAESQKPGGSAKINRMGINKLVSRMASDKIAALVVNYTYDQIGIGHGKVNAGGKALNFFSYLTIQSSRLAWVDAQIKGEKVRKGAKVRWKVFKNHAMKSVKDSEGNLIYLPKEIDLEITAEGIKRVK